MKQLMKIYVTLIFLLSPIFLIGQERLIADFNKDWKFQLGDEPQAIEENFNDASWRTLDLPHDWSIEEAYTTEKTSGSTAFLPTGIGWYRKTFSVPTDWKERLTSIEFDGVYRDSEVWINGHYLGKRPYGYMVFGYDLSEYLHYGAKNTITVKVDHSNYADSRWYTGSGIYRNVRLVTTSEIRIPQFGAWVETPEVSTKKAKAVFTTVIENNNASKNQKLKVLVTIRNDKNDLVAKAEKKLKVNERDTTQLALQILKPQLWDTENPHLYKAEISVYAGAVLKDNYDIDFGVRSIQFDVNEGFFLNGKPTKLKGVCLHHDAGAIGTASVKDVWRRRLELLKEIGSNAIRVSHNPADPMFLDLCDEMGFLVINEAFDEWKRNKQKWITQRGGVDMPQELETGYGDIFEEWGERDVKDLIRYSRNHPSIIMWSIGNEIEWTYPYYWKMFKSAQGLGNQVLFEETGDGKDELKETAEQLMAWIKEIDTTRPVTTGGVLPKSGNITGYYDVPDVMGYNYNAKQYDADHKTYPNRIIYGSENWGTSQEWKDVIERDFVAGIFIWTGIAYMGEAGPFPRKGLEISLLDFAGFYTPRGHLFKTLWSETPHTYLATKEWHKAEWVRDNGSFKLRKERKGMDQWTFEDVQETWNYDAEGDSVFVQVYSNAPEVELFVNDKSYGVKKMADFEDRMIKYVVPYNAGRIKAVGLKDGKVDSEYEISTAKWVSKIELRADRTEMSADGYAVAHIEAFVTDNKGNIVPDKALQMVFEVEGEGKNIGVDNGWENNVQNHKSNLIVTHQGKALLLVQSTDKEGIIKVRAKAGKLKSNEIIIRTEKLVP